VKVYECHLPYCRAEVYGRHAVCEDCWADRRRQLGALPDLYVLAHAMLTPGSRQQEISTIHVGPTPSVPCNLVILDALTLGYQRLAGWATWAARLARTPEPELRRHTSGQGFLTVVRTLLTHDHRLATTDSAGEYVLDVWVTYRRLLVQVVDTAPRSLGVDCPECGARTVLSRHADEYAICLTCAYVWPHSRFAALRREEG
jgi:ribosomal protein S27E